MNRKLNVGFLGVGNLVSKQHLPNAARCPWLTVHTLCDLNRETLAKYRTRYSPKKITADYRAMLADPEVELVVIAADPGRHAPLALEALRAGKHVYVEKPLAEDVQTCLEVAQVVEQTGRRLAVGYNRRFAPAYLDAFAIVQDEPTPLLMTYRMVDDFRDRPQKWTGRPRLLDECCHVFDVFNWFARSAPQRIFATGIGRKDDHQIVVEYANGATASLFTSSHGAFHWPKERLEIVGEHKVVAVEDFVELQTGGVPGWKDKRYAGCEYDGFSQGYARKFEELGLPYYRELRAKMGDLLLNSGVIESAPDREKWSVIAEKYPDQLRFPINYSCDKGWYRALADFGRAILDAAIPRNADARAGALTVAMSLAALESAQRGVPVGINVCVCNPLL